MTALASVQRLFGRLLSRSGTPVGATATAAPSPLNGTIRAMGQHASTLGREAAEVRGLIDDTTRTSARSEQAVEALGVQVQEITRAQDAIAEVSADSLGAMRRAREAVETIGSEVGGIVETLRGVSSAAGSITQIAMQTRLVAFNAAVEAKHAGDAGRGFGAVAEAVKDLAAKVESSSKEILRTVSELQSRIDALAVEIRTQPGKEGSGQFHRALADAEKSVVGMTEAAETSRGICAGLERQVGTIGSEMQQTGLALDAAMKRSESFLTVSETLIEQVAECGIETEDTPYIKAAIVYAGRIAAVIEAALAANTLKIDDVFDEAYRPVPGTDPKQFTTRFCALAEKNFPAVQEEALGLSDQVVYCIAVDRNGYVAIHNAKYNGAQRGDLEWDTANSRLRRVFNDRTGLASARNRKPFLLQTYRRDMGFGKFVVMKEVAAPITVQGRHWGGLRLAFKF